MFEEFFEYARSRHQIYLDRKAGKPYPWTSDPILLEYRFCNVYRELDTTTIWFREKIRESLRDSDEVLFATIAFRWFNRIETGEIIQDYLLTGAYKWDMEAVKLQLLGQKPIVTGSYIIKTPNGMDKLTGVLWCIEQLRLDCADLAHTIVGGASLEKAWEKLKEYPFLGDFMAYEIVTDLVHTHLLENAKDIDTWANPGPGAARGYSRILGQDPTYLNRNSKAHRKILIEGMQEILKESILHGFEDLDEGDWPMWAMREVEHTLCEFDKYTRVKNGEGRPRQLYRKPK